MLNCGLAFFNMLPIPVLDGGHITMALYEMIRGKALPLKLLEFATNICVICLLGFMLFVTMKDVGGLVEGGEKEEPVTFGPPAVGAAEAPASAVPAGN